MAWYAWSSLKMKTMLADDLARFLDDHQIVARRLGSLERLVRWSKRHRQATAAVGLVVLCGAIASTARMARLCEEQRRTVAALQTVREAQAPSARHFGSLLPRPSKS